MNFLLVLAPTRLSFRAIRDNFFDPSEFDLGLLDDQLQHPHGFVMPVTHLFENLV